LDIVEFDLQGHKPVGFVQAPKDFAIATGVFQGGRFPNNEISLMTHDYHGTGLTRFLDDVRDVNVGADVLEGLVVVGDVGVPLDMCVNGSLIGQGGRGGGRRDGGKGRGPF
jgi:hypothetical protein